MNNSNNNINDNTTTTTIFLGCDSIEINLVAVTGSCQPLHSDEYPGAYPVVPTRVTTQAWNNLQSPKSDLLSDECHN